MAQVLIISIFAFLFLQLAVGQDARACTNAVTTLTNNIASCTATADNPRIICTGQCRGYYQAIFDKCASAVSLVAIHSYIVADLCAL